MTTFVPYQPKYSLSQKIRRATTLVSASSRAIWKLLREGKGFAASVEVTDRCNAGCHYCYVYPSTWNQNQRMAGYSQLTKHEQKQPKQHIFGVLKELKESGIVHVTLVGGEPALAPKVLRYAADNFPIVWVVTNGAAKLPYLPTSATIFVSIDGPPDIHNQSRDPGGFFENHQFKNLTGMSAAIVKNINESERGAFVHMTLTPPNIKRFGETIDWLVRDIAKLRGIVVSGTTATSPQDPFAFTLEERQLLKKAIEAKAEQYGWRLFPFNQPKVNQFLFEPEHIIKDFTECPIALRIESLGFDGKSVGKCILRDDSDCSTCVCNMTGLQKAIETIDFPTIVNTIPTLFG
ncbi:MAG: radical SAM protein [Pseudanabaenales cyanobacterium]|nr:radical SAM protein [Pseudanabaenales cyanobacterium]